MTRILMLVVAALLSTACDGAYDKDMSSMNPLKHLATECVGRVLIDLPQGIGSWMQSFDNGDATRINVNSLEEFRSYVANRRDALKAARHNKAGTMLVAFAEPTEASAVVVLHTDPDVLSGPNLERYIWAGHTGYKLVTQALKEGTLDYAKKYYGVFGRLHSRSKDLIEAGFCIDAAVITGPPLGVTRADYNVRLTKWPNVSIGLLVEENQAQLGGSAFDSLKTEERVAEGRGGDVKLKQFRVLRKRTHDLDGFDGEETISLTELEDGTKFYSFRWRTLGQLKSIVHPHITVTMDTDNPLRDGRYIQTPPEEEMIGLWDAVLASLRHRPGAIPPGVK